MLDELQSILQGVYHLELGVRASDFYIDSEKLSALAEQGARHSSAQEQLLVLEEESGDASLALFIDDAVLERASARDATSAELTHEELHDFCLVTEGVSHFVYLAWKCGQGEPVTQLELELQAEVDKYVACYIARWEQDNGRFPEELKESLFRKARFRDDLAAEEHDRYRTANRLALRYCDWLERSFLRDGGLRDALPELCRFYRMTQPAKLDHIAGR